MNKQKSLCDIAIDLDLPWRVEWDSSSRYAPDFPGDDYPHWMIIGSGNVIKAQGFRRPDAQFVVDSVNAAAGGYGRPMKPKYKCGDVVRVIAPFDSGHFFDGTYIRARCINWVGQRAIIDKVWGNTYGIYLASEGPKSYSAWWEESSLDTDEIEE